LFPFSSHRKTVVAGTYSDNVMWYSIFDIPIFRRVYSSYVEKLWNFSKFWFADFPNSRGIPETQNSGSELGSCELESEIGILNQEGEECNEAPLMTSPTRGGGGWDAMSNEGWTDDT
jgi:hypothetical protein